MFNLRQSKVKKNDRELVWDMIERKGVIMRSDVADIIRIRKKDGDKAAKPVIIEFKNEYDKWMVLT